MSYSRWHPCRHVLLRRSHARLQSRPRPSGRCRGMRMVVAAAESVEAGVAPEFGAEDDERFRKQVPRREFIEQIGQGRVEYGCLDAWMAVLPALSVWVSQPPSSRHTKRARFSISRRAATIFSMKSFVASCEGAANDHSAGKLSVAMRAAWWLFAAWLIERNRVILSIRSASRGRFELMKMPGTLVGLTERIPVGLAWDRRCRDGSSRRT